MRCNPWITSAPRSDGEDRPMKTCRLAELMPALSVVALTLVAALPWGVPPPIFFFLPLLPFMAIHFWTVRRAELMPEWLVFASGLCTDVLTNGPLGFWSFIYLVGHVAALFLPLVLDWGTVGRWLHFATIMIGSVLLQWLTASLFFMNMVDSQAMMRSALVAVLAYPLLGLLFKPLNTLWLRPDNSSLVRGI
jgi:rod shape-determining protein MreD